MYRVSTRHTDKNVIGVKKTKEKKKDVAKDNQYYAQAFNVDKHRCVCICS